VHLCLTSGGSWLEYVSLKSLRVIFPAVSNEILTDVSKCVLQVGEDVWVLDQFFSVFSESLD